MLQHTEMNKERKIMKVKSKPNNPIRIRTRTIGVRVHGVATTPLTTDGKCQNGGGENQNSVN